MSGRDSFFADFDVPRETQARLERYAELLTRWQRRINLVGPKTLPAMWRRHFLDSAQLLPLVAERRGLPAVWFDMGAGAGFPGLVLSIMGAGRVHLAESDVRKCAFLRQVIMATDAPARVHQARLEALEPFAVDIVTARALAPLDRLLGYAEPFCAPQTECWFLKGEEAEQELTACAQSWTFDSEVFPSRSDPRGRILRIRKLARVSAS